MPNEFASEAEYREYMQHEADQQRGEYEQPHGQGYEQSHGYDQGQGYPQEYADAPYPPQGSSPVDYPPQAQGPPEYVTPHAQDGGMVASGGAARGDGKYGYVPR